MAKAWWRDSDYELFARLTKERDEARAEVERLMHQLADQTNETTRARLEAKRAAEEAYLRGAEAMREACEAAIHAAPEGAFAERVIRALPIPEEP